MTRWYRAYEGTVSDPKLAEAALIAEVSRSVCIAAWHAILENCAALQDQGRFDLTPRRLAIILAEPPADMDRVIKAFVELEMLADNVVTAWQRRQYESQRAAASHDKDPGLYVYFIGTSWGEPVKIGHSRNPWARLKDFQTGHPSTLRILGVTRTVENSEVDIHDLLKAHRRQGEWFDLPTHISDVIATHTAAKGSHYVDLLASLRETLHHPVATTVATLRSTTTETEQNRDRDRSRDRDRAETVADDARAQAPEPKADFIEVGKRVLAAMGISWGDPRWTGDVSRVQAWLSEGYDPDLDILPCIELVMSKRAPGDPPKSLRYFEQAIFEHRRRRVAPVPPAAQPAEKPGARMSTIVDRMIAEEAARAAKTKGAAA